MKHTFKYILFISALFSFSMTSFAQDVTETYHNENQGVATGKQVSGPNNDGSYTITLETFATGESMSVTKAAPSDIVLVLDFSQSMTANYKSSYVEQASTTYNYNGFPANNSGLYYKHGENEYYQVSRGGNNNRRYLRYHIGNNNNTNYYYLTPDGVVGPAGNNPPAGTTFGNSATIYSGVLYRLTQQSRIDALKDAVDGFVDVIYHNDNYDDNDNQRTTPLGNRISIVVYSANNTTSSRQLLGWTDVTTGTGRDKNATIMNTLNAETNTPQGTYSNRGMTLANTLLSQCKTDVDDPDSRWNNSTRTVVLFTDGIPGGYTQWNEPQYQSATVANGCILAAKSAKNDYDAKVFTVALYEWPSNPSNYSEGERNMRDYMNYTSSNYMNAESLTEHGDGTYDGDYFKLAGEDLEGVFRDIASQSGGADYTIPASTQVRDVVSSSFNLPEGFNASSVSVYTVDVKPSGLEFYGPDDSGYAQHKHTLTVVTGQTGEGEANADYLTNEDKVLLVIGSDRISVEGFDYSKGDGDELGSGNWVGPRISGSQSTFYGKELVIEFNIKPEKDATGGDATNTNANGSGVYVLRDGQYVSVNDYVKPHTDLPTVIKISKKGLRRGESATFQIVKYRPIGWNEDNPSDISGYQWTVVGKPMPDPATQKDFSKVILTNKNGDENTEIVKTLMALDPSWIYEVYEDDWAWSYTYDGSVSMTTSDVEVNPFRFTNSKNEEAVKHAEAVSINHFANETIGLESRVENIKSNETFDTN